MLKNFLFDGQVFRKIKDLFFNHSKPAGLGKTNQRKIRLSNYYRLKKSRRQMARDSRRINRAY